MNGFLVNMKSVIKLHYAFHVLNTIQNSLRQEDFECIWKLDHKHFYEKWERDYNLLTFLTRLDEYNREKFLTYFCERFKLS